MANPINTAFTLASQKDKIDFLKHLITPQIPIPTSSIKTTRQVQIHLCLSCYHFEIINTEHPECSTCTNSICTNGCPQIPKCACEFMSDESNDETESSDSSQTTDNTETDDEQTPEDPHTPEDDNDDVEIIDHPQKRFRTKLPDSSR